MAAKYSGRLWLVMGILSVFVWLPLGALPGPGVGGSNRIILPAEGAVSIKILGVGPHIAWNGDFGLDIPRRQILVGDYANHVGATAALGNFSRDTELVFFIYVYNTGQRRYSNNPAHCAITANGDAWILNWEDGGDTNFTDLTVQVNLVRTPNYPPFEPANPSPPHLSTNQPLDTQLTWSGGDPNSGDTVNYAVYFWEQGQPAHQLCPPGPATTCNPGALAYNTTYDWYVYATDNHGATARSDNWRFTARGLLPPRLLPIDNADGDGSYQLTWQPASGAQVYTVQQDASPWFSDPLSLYPGSETFYAFSGQLPGEYYYRARSEAGAVTSPWSEPVSTTVYPPEYVIEGQVALPGDLFADHTPRPLKYAYVELLKDGQPLAKPLWGYTSAAGRYRLAFTPPHYPPQGYSLRLALEDVDPAYSRSQGSSLPLPVFQVQDREDPAPHQPTVYIEQDVGFETAQQVVVDFTTFDNQERPLRDYAMHYLAVARVKEFITQHPGFDYAAPELPAPGLLSACPTLHVVSHASADTQYKVGTCSVIIAGRDSAWNLAGFPFTIWHETWHAVMHRALGEQAFRIAGTNHGGYTNPTTQDSWNEGWAAFWPPAMMASPQYWINTSQVSLEENRRAWDADWLIQREDLALAALLWDLTDGVDANDHDGVQITVDDFWRFAVVQPQPGGPVRTVFDLYRTLLAHGVGQQAQLYPGPEWPGAQAVSALDRVFIEHGFFYDANGNRDACHSAAQPQLACHSLLLPGEAVVVELDEIAAVEAERGIGRAASAGNPGRRYTPHPPNAAVLLNVYDAAGQPLDEVYLRVELRYHPPYELYSYAYTLTVDGAAALVSVILPPPDSYSATLQIQALDPAGGLHYAPLQIDNDVYWQLAAASTSGYALQHDFYPPTLSLALNAAPARATLDETLLYTLAITNHGPGPTGDLLLVAPLPTDTVYLPGSVTGGASYNPTLERVEWAGSLPAGQAVVLRYSLRVAAYTTSTLGAQASLAGYRDDFPPAAVETRRPPLARFRIAQEGQTHARLVAFVDESLGEIGSWRWEFGDGSSSSERFPHHWYGLPGSYTVTLTTLGTGGQSVSTRPAYIQVAAPTLELGHTALPDGPAAPGGVVAYALAVRNTGVVTAANVVISATLPVQAILLNATPNYRLDGPALVWEFASLSPGASELVAVRVQLAGDLTVGSLVTSTAGLSAAALDSLPGSTITRSVTLLPALGLAALAVALPAPELGGARPGDLLVYTIAYTNSGALPASGVQITDPLPPYTEYISGGSYQDGAVVFEVGDLPAGASGQVSLTLRLADEAPPGAWIHNVASMASQQTGAFPTWPLETLVLAPRLDLALDGPQGELLPGDEWRYSVKVTNRGNLAAANAWLQLVFDPAQFPGTPVQPVPLGDLAPGASQTRLGMLRLGSGLPAGVTATLSALAGCNRTAAASSGTLLNTVILPQLAVQMAADPSGPVQPGDAVLYVLTYTNSSPRTVHAARLGASLPPGLLFQQGGTYVGSEVTWDLGDLLPGQAGQLSFRAILADGVGQVTNQAWIGSSQGGQQTSRPVTITVQAPALQVRQAVDPFGEVYPGDLLRYTLVYTNAGSQAAIQAQLLALLPEGLEHVAGGAYQAQLRAVRFDLGDVAGGQGGLVGFTVRLSATHPGQQLWLHTQVFYAPTYPPGYPPATPPEVSGSTEFGPLGGSAGLAAVAQSFIASAPRLQRAGLYLAGQAGPYPPLSLQLWGDEDGLPDASQVLAVAYPPLDTPGGRRYVLEFPYPVPLAVGNRYWLVADGRWGATESGADLPAAAAVRYAGNDPYPQGSWVYAAGQDLAWQAWDTATDLDFELQYAAPPTANPLPATVAGRVMLSAGLAVQAPHSPAAGDWFTYTLAVTNSGNLVASQVGGEMLLPAPLWSWNAPLQWRTLGAYNHTAALSAAGAALDQDGNAYFLWREASGKLFFRSFVPALDQWGEAVQLPNINDDLQGASLAAGSSGVVYVAWGDADGLGVQFSTNHGRSWSAPYRLDSYAVGYPPSLAAWQGQVYILWERAGSGALFFARSLAGSSSWQVEPSIDHDAFLELSPLLAVDQCGRLYAAWKRAEDGAVYVRPSLDGGSGWLPPARVLYLGSLDEFSLTAQGCGVAYLQASRYPLAVTRDGGLTWEQAGTAAGAENALLAASGGQQLYALQVDAALHPRLLHSADGGQNWRSILGLDGPPQPLASAIALAAGPNGQVCLAWTYNASWRARCGAPATYGPISLGQADLLPYGGAVFTLPVGMADLFTGDAWLSGLATATYTATGTVLNARYDQLVHGRPGAALAGEPLAGEPPLDVQFTATPVGTVTGWQWDFGDGGTSPGQNPRHQYRAPGFYTVTLTVQGPGGSGTLSLPAYIRAGQLPQAAFSAAPLTGTWPLSVTFTDLSRGVYERWRWDFGDSQTSTLPGPTHVYTDTGIYSATLVVDGPLGAAQAALPVQITVNDLLVPLDPLTVGEKPYSLAAADLDQDGSVDLVVSHWSTAAPRLLLNRGVGRFEARSLPAGQARGYATVADLNRDGRADIIMGDNLRLWVLFNQGQAAFAPPVVYDLPLSLLASPGILPLDLDLDGDLDLALASGEDYRAVLGIMLNHGDGRLAWNGSYPLGDRPLILASFDLDGNGYPDLVAANNFGHDLSVLINQGQGQFASPQHYDLGPDSYPSSLFGQDVDSDGDLDLVVLCNGRDLRQVENLGSGALRVAGWLPQRLEASGGSSTAYADLDGDGRQDWLTTGAGAGKLILLLDRNGGVFRPALYPAGQAPGELAAHDLDGDGDIDLAVSDYDRAQVWFFFNQRRAPSPPLPARRLFLPLVRSP